MEINLLKLQVMSICKVKGYNLGSSYKIQIIAIPCYGYCSWHTCCLIASDIEFHVALYGKMFVITFDSLIDIVTFIDMLHSFQEAVIV